MAQTKAMICMLVGIALAVAEATWAMTAASIVPGYTVAYNQTYPNVAAAFVVAGDVIVMGSNPATAVSVTNGSVMWAFHLDAGAQVDSVAVVPCLPDAVLVSAAAHNNSTVTALDLRTGAVVWTQTTQFGMAGATCLTTGEPLVIIMAEYPGPNSLVVTLDARTGKAGLTFALPYTANRFLQASADQLITCGGPVTCDTHTNSLVTGALLWSQSTSAPDDDYQSWMVTFDSQGNGYFSQRGTVFKRDAAGNLTATANLPTVPHNRPFITVGNAGVYVYVYSASTLMLYTQDLHLVWSNPNVPYATIMDDSSATYILAIPGSSPTIVLSSLNVQTGAVTWNVSVPIPSQDEVDTCNMALYRQETGTPTVTVSCGSFVPTSFNEAHTTLVEVDAASGIIARQSIFSVVDCHPLRSLTLPSASGVIPLYSWDRHYILGVAPNE